MNVLFICSKNEWRSRTAETIFRKETRFIAKSAGTSRTARIRVSRNLIDWADLIFVMEDHHKARLPELYGEPVEKEIVVLDIPDEYQYMDEELISELQDAVSYYVEERNN
ncbi:MAG: protein tyrosine phosphatase [Bacteroidota bacterium]